MKKNCLIQKLGWLLLLEVLFELLESSILIAIGEYNNLLFLFIDKCFFLVLLMFLNARLTQQKITLSVRLGTDQKKLVIILASILLLLGFIRNKNVLAALAIGLMAATTEEYLYRGIVLGNLLRLFSHTKTGLSQILFPAIISSVLFGLQHFIHLYGQSLPLTVMQVCQTMGMGFLFASIFLRTKNLLFSMICHFSFDFVITVLWGIRNNQGISFAGVFVMTLVYTFIAFVILVPVLADKTLSMKKNSVKNSK